MKIEKKTTSDEIFFVWFNLYLYVIVSPPFLIPKIQHFHTNIREKSVEEKIVETKIRKNRNMRYKIGDVI